ncbi:PQQ-binding-like beta-propeller repeat protein [Corallococcus sp. AS-1-12]|uniref:PQQ-binding-like beta-propeller repeat protein n=1 Tax=Corallococcus sp. AS-1-12 TaxID=2874598 RepID=UPI001CBE9693|nr:PQQ-binding-like beta-propeller repeat protein [Corallococcus sp. AS-1-12]MBZ4333424.1 PQQ-like beta-propeller repeat protein [Corallococcus sp. AS-1-12]
MQRPTNSALLSVDLRSREETPLYTTPAGMLFTDALLVSDGVAYVVGKDTDVLHAIDVVSRREVWRYATGTIASDTPKLYMFDGLVVFRLGATIYAVDRSGTLAWKYLIIGDVSQADSDAIAVGQSLIMSVSADGVHMVFCFDLHRGTLLWYYDAGTFPWTAPAAGDGMVVLGFTDGSVRALDLTTGALKWAYAAGKPDLLLPSLVVADGAVYCATKTGALFALDTVSGQRVPSFSFDAEATLNTPLIARDGLLYLAAEPTSGLPARVIAVDLVSHGQEAMVYTLPPDVTTLSPLTLQGGVTYFFQAGRQDLLTAVNLTGTIREFLVESELIVEEYDDESPTPVPLTSSFRTHVVLMDEDKVPRPLQTVQVTASMPVRVRIEGTWHDVAPDKPVWVTTGASGDLTLITEPLKVSSPALMLWSGFMLPNESIVIYPDEQVLARLATVQSKDLAPEAARDFRGNPVLLDQYQPEAQRHGIAEFIRNTLGTQRLDARRTNDRTRYLAYPSAMPNTVYEARGGGTSRPLSPGAIAHWDLNLTGGQVSFSQLIGARRETLRAGAEASRGLLGGFKEFVSNVVHGAEHVASVAWDFAVESAEAVVSVAKGFYKFTVHTVEQALDVVLGVLKDLVSGIEAVVQWLSYLFDWPAFIETHHQLKSYLRDRVGMLQKWIDDEITSGISGVKQLLRDADDGIDGFFDKVISELKDKSCQSERAGHTDPMLYFSAGGAKSYVQSHWAMSKLKDATLEMGASPFEPIVSAVRTFIDAVKQNVGDQLPQLGADVTAVFHDFERLVTDPAGFLQTTLADLLSVFRDLAKVLLGLATAMAEAFMVMMRGLAGQLLALLDQPVRVPVISSIYKKLVGSELSALDACTLVVAIPTTIVARALHRTASAGSPDGLQMLIPLAYTFAYTLYTPLDAMVELQDSKQDNPLYNRMALFAYAAGTMTIFLGLPWGQLEISDFILVILELIPLFFSCANTFTPWYACAYGIGMVGFYVFLAVLRPDSYMGKGGLILIADIASVVPFIAKPIRLIKDSEMFRAIVAGFDMAGDLTTLILGALSTWVVNDASPEPRLAAAAAG